MLKGFRYSLGEAATIVVLSALFFFVAISEDVPRWLRIGVVSGLVLWPLVFPLVLIPWMFLARRQGLAIRGRTLSAVQLSETSVVLIRGATTRSVPWGEVKRARFAQNSNWTESTLVEAALQLFGPDGKERVRVPESAQGFELLLQELKKRNVPKETVEVSAPAFLD